MAKEELGVADMAKHIKRSEATTRNLLRKNKVKRSGKAYVWPSVGAMQAAAKKLTGETPKKKKKTVEKAAA
jgi:hypothetical protein